LVERLAELDKSDSSLRISDSGHLTFSKRNGDGSQRIITDLVRVSNLILSVEVIPDVKEPIHSSEEEESFSMRSPTTISEVGVVVFSLHERSLELFRPDLGSPVSNCKEVFTDGRVSLDSIHWSVMLSSLETILLVDLNRSSRSLIHLEDISLLSSHQILHWASFIVILKPSSSEDLLTCTINVIVEGEGVNRSIIKVSEVPPKKSTICGGRHALSPCLSMSQPVNIINWIVVRLLKNGSVFWSDSSVSVSLSEIEEGKRTIVGTSS